MRGPTRLSLIAIAGAVLAACGGSSEPTHGDSVVLPATDEAIAEASPPDDAPRVDEVGVIYGTTYYYEYQASDDAPIVGINTEYLADADGARLFRSVMGESEPYYFAEFSGLLSIECDKPMPPQNVIEALARYDTKTVGETLSIQARSSEPLYDYKVEGQAGSDPNGVSHITRTYDGVDVMGEIHTYTDKLSLSTYKQILMREAWGSGGIAHLQGATPPESAFVQDMKDMVEDDQIGTCADLF